jgi:hypothetical protein
MIYCLLTRRDGLAQPSQTEGEDTVCHIWLGVDRTKKRGWCGLGEGLGLRFSAVAAGGTCGEAFPGSRPETTSVAGTG